MPHDVVDLSVCHRARIVIVIVWPSCFCRSKKGRHDLVLLMCGKNGPIKDASRGNGVFIYVAIRWYLSLLLSFGNKTCRYVPYIFLCINPRPTGVFL